MNEHVLDGCIVTPLSNYLKTLGLFRILAVKDPNILAYWKNKKFVIKTNMDRDELVRHLLNDYAPTPIINPWSYTTYVQTRDKINDNITDHRFNLYKKTIKEIDGVIKEFCNIPHIKDKIKVENDKNLKKNKTQNNTPAIETIKSIISDKENKLLFLQLCRNKLSDEMVSWMDAAFVLGDRIHSAPILATGGIDGRFDMAINFVKRLEMVLPKKISKQSEAWLRSALYGDIAALKQDNISGHNPDGCGGPNSGMGFEGKSISNPWDYVLMMEGSLLLAGNMARRQSMNKSRAVFPFTADGSNVGYQTSSKTETSSGLEPEFRGEVWLPLWENPAAYKEIEHIFSEGRVELNKKQASTGTEFARAVITMGTERGISQFQRFCFLKRKGKAYLAVNSGGIRTEYKPAAHLLMDLDSWHHKIEDKTKEKHASASLIEHARDLDSKIMNFCTSKKNDDLLNVLISVGKLERYVARGGIIKPLRGLSDGWITSCYDGTPEFRLAASIASIHAVNKLGPIRENLESIAIKGGVAEHLTNPVSCVWREGDDLSRNLSRILQRRGIDGNVRGLDKIPITGRIPAKICDIIEFLDGNLDTKKIGDLILPLSMITITKDTEYPWRDSVRKDAPCAGLPEPYAVIKLICPPDDEETMPYDMSVLNLLHAKRFNSAYEKASYLLHAHGLSPLTYSKNTGVASNLSLSYSLKEHLMAALLFPISAVDRKSMLENVCNIS